MRISNNPPNRLIIPNYNALEDVINFSPNYHDIYHTYRNKYSSVENMIGGVAWVKNYPLYIAWVKNYPLYIILDPDVG